MHIHNHVLQLVCQPFCSFQVCSKPPCGSLLDWYILHPKLNVIANPPA